jgi:hypothetical protein
MCSLSLAADRLARVESPLVCTNAAQRSAEDWGDPLRALGAELLSIPGRCFTKQTGDMVYTMAENSWLSQLWLGA